MEVLVATVLEGAQSVNLMECSHQGSVRSVVPKCVSQIRHLGSIYIEPTREVADDWREGGTIAVGFGLERY